MAMSLRKAPKFRRKGYQRLGHRRPWDSDNETIFAEDQSESAAGLSNEKPLELSKRSPRNRLRNTNSDINGEGSSKYTQDEPQEFLMYKIQPEDTLQGIALKYGCSVAELKRVNNLLQDQDAFALQEIRIPAREHSVLFEIFSQQNTCSSGTENNSKTIHLSINQMMHSKHDKEPSQFLKDMDRDIQQMVEKAQSQQNLDLENQTASSATVIHPLVKPYYDGANWGINWYCLLVVLLVVSVLAPVTYGIYFVTQAHDKNSTAHR